MPRNPRKRAAIRPSPLAPRPSPLPVGPPPGTLPVVNLSRSLAALLGLGLLLVAAGCASPAPEAPRGTGGSATVTFVNPSQFTDFTGSGPSGQADEARLLAELEQYVRDEAPRHLAADRRLDVRILDLDAGGRTGRGPRRVRVSDGNTTAQIVLEYTLTDTAGKQVAAGQRRLVQSAASMATDTGSEDMPLLQKALRSWLKEIGKL